MSYRATTLPNSKPACPFPGCVGELGSGMMLRQHFQDLHPKDLFTTPKEQVYPRWENCSVGRRVPVCHLSSPWLTLSVVPTGPSKCCLNNLKVFSCSKLSLLLYLLVKLQKLCCVESRENHGPNLAPSSFNLDLFFVCTYKYVHTYRTSLRYYITPTHSCGTLTVPSS